MGVHEFTDESPPTPGRWPRVVFSRLRCENELEEDANGGELEVAGEEDLLNITEHLARKVPEGGE